jgi:hypothetical protein
MDVVTNRNLMQSLVPAFDGMLLHYKRLVSGFEFFANQDKLQTLCYMLRGKPHYVTTAIFGSFCEALAKRLAKLVTICSNYHTSVALDELCRMTDMKNCPDEEVLGRRYGLPLQSIFWFHPLDTSRNVSMYVTGIKFMVQDIKTRLEPLLSASITRSSLQPTQTVYAPPLKRAKVSSSSCTLESTAPSMMDFLCRETQQSGPVLSSSSPSSLAFAPTTSSTAVSAATTITTNAKFQLMVDRNPQMGTIATQFIQRRDALVKLRLNIVSIQEEVARKQEHVAKCQRELETAQQELETAQQDIERKQKEADFMAQNLDEARLFAEFVLSAGST